MLIKTGYPNLLHGCDFLCFNLMNYSWVWEAKFLALLEGREDHSWAFVNRIPTQFRLSRVTNVLVVFRMLWFGPGLKRNQLISSMTFLPSSLWEKSHKLTMACSHLKGLAIFLQRGVVEVNMISSPKFPAFHRAWALQVNRRSLPYHLFLVKYWKSLDSIVVLKLRSGG